MNRHSTRLKAADDSAWPIRVCVVVPESGFAGAGIDPHAWLTKNLGLGGYALHPAGRTSSDVVAIYFRSFQDMQRFFEAFPTLHLADDTASPLYQSPHKQR